MIFIILFYRIFFQVPVLWIEFFALGSSLFPWRNAPFWWLQGGLGKSTCTALLCLTDCTFVAPARILLAVWICLNHDSIVRVEAEESTLSWFSHSAVQEVDLFLSHPFGSYFCHSVNSSRALRRNKTRKWIHCRCWLIYVDMKGTCGIKKAKKTNLSVLRRRAAQLRSHFTCAGTRMWGESFYATVALLLFAMVLPTLGLWCGTSVLSKASKASCKLLRLLLRLLKFVLHKYPFLSSSLALHQIFHTNPRLLPRYFHADVEADVGEVVKLEVWLFETR